jgi:hypothetical protein
MLGRSRESGENRIWRADRQTSVEEIAFLNRPPVGKQHVDNQTTQLWQRLHQSVWFQD